MLGLNTFWRKLGLCFSSSVYNNKCFFIYLNWQKQNEQYSVQSLQEWGLSSKFSPLTQGCLELITNFSAIFSPSCHGFRRHEIELEHIQIKRGKCYSIILIQCALKWVRSHGMILWFYENMFEYHNIMFEEHFFCPYNFDIAMIRAHLLCGGCNCTVCDLVVAWSCGISETQTIWSDFINMQFCISFVKRKRLLHPYYSCITITREDWLCKGCHFVVCDLIVSFVILLNFSCLGC